MTLNSGISTGSCAALAAKAAVLLLVRQEQVGQVEIPMPDGSRLSWPVVDAQHTPAGAQATVIKDAGDDPDVTHGTQIQAEVTPGSEPGIVFGHVRVS